MTYALLIDDDAGIRESLQRVAEVSDLSLLTAATWEEGLAVFQVHSPEVVIADYNLPGSKHGLQLLAEIRRLSPSVRLLLLSAYIDDGDVADIESLGLVDRAIPKSGANDTTAQLLDEIARAKERAGEATDWSAYARAKRTSTAVEQADIDALDSRLKKARGIS